MAATLAPGAHGRLGPFSRYGFALCALPALLRAAWHLRQISGEQNLERLAATMGRGRPFRWAFLRQPRYHAGLVEKLVAFLPPRRWGPCLKKSLLLMELWTRCGLSPKLHLGAQIRQGGNFDFHAWISAGELVYGRVDHEELWSS